MNIVVLAIDPGITSGYVAARITDKFTRIRPMQFRHNELQFYEFLVQIQPNIIVCEDFEIRPKSPVNLELFSVRLIGIAHLFQQMTYSCGAIHMQKAGIGEGGHYRGSATLKKAGVYVPGAAYHHSMSAMRHFMQWYNFRGGYQYNKGQPLELMK